VRVTAPFGFYDFNKLLMNCRCLLSDSGSAPKESYFYKVPCVSMRMMKAASGGFVRDSRMILGRVPNISHEPSQVVRRGART
jgi:UDP-N-acetylglucosamine 2-epimerase